jgi:hypothetical protein
MEGLINSHKDALLKRKRADEEIKESYDALLEGVRQERVQQVMDKMGDGVETTLERNFMSMESKFP